MGWRLGAHGEVGSGPLPLPTIGEHTARSARHSTFYLAAGPNDGPLIVFLHGWPELSVSWRHQLPVMAGLGFRAVAPDLRGYGRSQLHGAHAAYALEEIVADMLELLDALGAERAVWVGHDWGGPAAWSIANHHPERCVAVASLCAPYRTIELGLGALAPLIDRRVHPADRYPFGQWEYMRFHEENFEKARRTFEANPYNTVKALFRKGSPKGRGQPAPTARVRQDGGWFGGAAEAPDLARDDDVASESELRFYAEALQRNGFFGPDSWYMNHAANAAYATRAVDGGHIAMPALFLAAAYDYVCESVDSRLAEPMRAYCRDLTERTIACGHWMAQEKPAEVNAALVRWLAAKAPEFWPQ